MATEGRSRPLRFSVLLPTLVALVGSLIMHTAIPVATLAIPAKKAQSRAQIELIRTPPADNPVEPETPLPDAKAEKDPVKVPPKVPKKKAPEKQPPKKAPKKTAKETARDTRTPPEEASAPKVLTTPKGNGGRIVKATAAQLAKQFRARLKAQRDQRRRDRLAALAKKNEARDAAIAEDRRKNGVGGIPPGDPRALFACEATTRGNQIHLRAERAVRDWVAIVPTVLMPFDTRPSLSNYLDQTTQVVKRGRSGVRRVGSVEMALPQEVLQLPLDMPPGGRLAVGHLDGRCLVGFSYTRKSKDLFPIVLKRVPVRMMFGGKTTKALVDFTMNRDANFEIALHDKVDADKAGKLLFRAGRLKNGNGIQNTISSHINAAQTLNEVAGWFGLDVKKMSQEGRKERLKESVKTVSKDPPRKNPKATTSSKRGRSSSSSSRGRGRRRR